MIHTHANTETMYLSDGFKVLFVIQDLLIYISTHKANVYADSSLNCPTEVCTCKKGIIECRNRSLSYIPVLPKDTREIDFSENPLNILENSTFKNISGLRIRKLSLSSCNITEIKEVAFASFKSIQALDLSGNMLNFSSTVLSVGLGGLHGSKITVLNLSTQKLSNQFLPNEAFEGLADTEIDTMLLADGNLKRIDGKIFSKLKYLRFLNVSSNDLEEAHLDGLSSLEKLDLSNNDLCELRISSNLEFLTFLDVSNNNIRKVNFVRLCSLKLLDLSRNKMERVPSFCNSSNSSYVPSLEFLNISENHISDLGQPEGYGNCLQTLKELRISFNPIGLIRTKQFFSMKSLKTLDLNPLLVTRFLFEKFAFSSKSLEHIAIAVHKHVVIKDHFQMFENCSSLKKLVMRNFKLNELSDKDLRIIFKPIINITSLSILYAHLNYIPSFISAMRQLRHLSFYGNYISHWEEDTFRGLTKLKHINLCSNWITVINETSFPPYFLQKVRNIFLWNNPFSCTCDNYWFISWGKNNKKKLRNGFTNEYRCNSPPRLNYRPMSWYNPSYLECHGLEPYQVAIVVSSTFVLGFITIVILYRRYKWHLRYYFYLMRSKKVEHNVSPDREFIYDAFVAYTSEDRSWVISNLMAVLEGEHKFSLCLHERDFLPGLTILDQISETMKQSRKVILVLSNNFAKSQWCQYEILMAQYRFLDEGGNSLILILLDEIKEKYKTNCLGMLLRTMSYISWTTNSERKKLFWNKVIVSMKN